MNKSNAANIRCNARNGESAMYCEPRAPPLLSSYSTSRARSFVTLHLFAIDFISLLAHGICIGRSYVWVCACDTLYSHSRKKSHTKMLLRYVSSCYSVSTQTKSRMFHCTSERSYCRSNERLFALTLRSVQWLRNKSDDKISVGRNVKFFVSVKMDSVDSKCNWQLIRMIFIKLRLVCSLFLYKMKFLHVYIVSASLLFDFAEFYSQCCTSAFAYLYSH